VTAEPEVSAPSQLPCDIDELRTLFLFEKLTEEQLDWLCRNGHVEVLDPGYAFREGEPAAALYVLLEGEMATSRRVGTDDVEVVRTTSKGVYAGAFMAYLGDRLPQTYNNTMRVIATSRFYVLDAARFSELMHEWFPMAVHLLEGLFFGTKSLQQAVGQRERLLALGSLSAGLTHELNNPAAAAVRATSALRERVAAMREELQRLASVPYDAAAVHTMVELQDSVVARLTDASTLTPMQAADLEDAVTDWLDDHGLDDGGDIAATFVQAGVDGAWLDALEQAVPADVLGNAVRWLGNVVGTELLLDEVEDAAARISTLVAAAKQYSQLDRAPYRVVDVHELITSTLLMLSRKIGDGITVVKDFDRTLPTISAYAAELNQVWTNLIDNAVQAMDGTGTLTVRTSRVGEDLQVEIGDTGPGVPPDLVERIFEPFFTTKPVGEGTGLGLDISWRIVVNKHHGDLSVTSVPGDTRFRVRLPLTAEADS
jgi:signal transduction histidine kinase